MTDASVHVYPAVQVAAYLKAACNKPACFAGSCSVLHHTRMHVKYTLSCTTFGMLLWLHIKIQTD